MECPKCGHKLNVGKMMGSLRSDRKAESSRQNGKRGGRPKEAKESLSPVDMPKMPTVNSPWVNLIDSTGCQSRPFLEELSAASVTHRCQGFNCKRTDTTRTEVAGCGVWLCPEHSKK